MVFALIFENDMKTLPTDLHDLITYHFRRRPKLSFAFKLDEEFINPQNMHNCPNVRYVFSINMFQLLIELREKKHLKTSEM